MPSITWLLNLIDSGGTSDASGISGGSGLGQMQREMLWIQLCYTILYIDVILDIIINCHRSISYIVKYYHIYYL